ncbi:hypothetical protein BKA64DRAFT_746456 [Cadophora sp. MPI-SDFR-AT-0126]|nr:hypothetical protein BKA64DRAFT_746456 [Leotiomycetes sp. MPI-SDFR-AT-0126]
MSQNTQPTIPQPPMATSFPSFPLLPKELRLTIWNLALEPRIVELCFEVFDEEDEEGNENSAQYDEPANENPSIVQKDNGVKENQDEDDDENADEDEGRDKNQQNEADSLEFDDNILTATDNTDSISETPDPTYSRALGPGQFYSPSPLPSLLHVNSEARSVALAAALKGFPVPSNQEDVYYNPEIDILYFPAGCWQEDIMGFEQAVSQEVKRKIRRIALEENLMWMSYWEEGTVNGQITIGQFKNVKEFIFAMRELTQCGCCISFDGPESGLVEFVDIHIESEIEEVDAAAEAEPDSEVEMNRANDELRRQREREALGLGVVEDYQAPESKAKTEKKPGKFAYTKKYVDRLKEEFLIIKESHPDWNVPEARIVRLMRDGEFAGDP